MDQAFSDQIAREGFKPRKRRTGCRLGLYNPDPDVQEIRWVGKAVRCTPNNIADLRAAIAEFNKLAEQDDAIESCLGIFSVSG